MNDLSKLTFSGRDEFNRRGIAEKLIQLLESDIEVTPMLIEGEWGTGKTEFCYKLINLIDEDTNLNSIYIDAYAEDHLDDPLIMILGNLSKYIEQNLIKTKPEIKEKFFKAAIPVVKFLLKTSLKAGVNLVLKQNADTIVEELQDTIKEAGEEAINGTIEALIEDQEKAQENINQLKAVIEIIIKDAPIIIFIDELDRCRPDFSIKLLEKIKHVFEVKNLKFILLVNRAQLKATITHTYGNQVEAHRYLDKFFKFSFKISPYYPESRVEFHCATIKHFRAIINNDDYLKATNLISSRPFELMKILLETHNITLRESETFARYLRIYRLITNKNVFVDNNSIKDYVRIVGVFIFCFKPELCHSIDFKEINIQEICQIIGIKKHINRQYANTPNVPQCLAFKFSKDLNRPIEGLNFNDHEEIKFWSTSMQDTLGINNGINSLDVMSAAFRELRLAN